MNNLTRKDFIISSVKALPLLIFPSILGLNLNNILTHQDSVELRIKKIIANVFMLDISDLKDHRMKIYGDVANFTIGSRELDPQEWNDMCGTFYIGLVIDINHEFGLNIDIDTYKKFDANTTIQDILNLVDLVNEHPFSIT